MVRSRSRRSQRASPERRAEFQLSLGFIISIVFAVVLLTLAIAWLQGIFGSITNISEDLFADAREEILKTFNDQRTNFAIWPTYRSLSAGKSLKMGAGVINDNLNGEVLTYFVNVIPVDSNLCQNAANLGKSFVHCETVAGANVAEMMRGWITFDRSIGTANVGSTVFKPIFVNPPKNAIKGIYVYTVVACSAPDGSTQATTDLCVPQSNNRWGNPQSLTIEVTA